MALSAGCSRCGGTSSWRQQAFRRQAFVPVRIEAEPGEPGNVAPAPTRPQMVSRRAKLGGIEIEVSGALIRVEPGVDAATLCTVLSALRGGR